MQEKIIKSSSIKMVDVKTMLVITLVDFVVAYISFMFGYIWLFSMLLDDKISDIPDGLQEFLMGIGIILAIVGVFIIAGYLYFSKMQIVVTNKRVYGKVAFGKQVDLPLDSISAVGIGAFKGITVGTSSGKISFYGISNRDEIYEEIKGLLVNRQLDSSKEKINTSHQQGSADELLKFKELLDSDIITQEEFDAKKKQLLGL